MLFLDIQVAIHELGEAHRSIQRALRDSILDALVSFLHILTVHSCDGNDMRMLRRHHFSIRDVSCEPSGGRSCDHGHASTAKGETCTDA